MNLNKRIELMTERQKQLKSQLDCVISEYGSLKPQNVVDSARSKESPLHDHFEWDDGIAGEKYRLQQARQLVATVYHVSDEEKKVFVKTFHSVVVDDDDSSSRQYVEITKIMSDEMLRVQLLNSAKRDMQTFAKKYRHLNELVGVISEIDKISQVAIEDFKEQVEARASA